MKETDVFDYFLREMWTEISQGFSATVNAGLWGDAKAHLPVHPDLSQA